MELPYQEFLARTVRHLVANPFRSRRIFSLVPNTPVESRTRAEFQSREGTSLWKRESHLPPLPHPQTLLHALQEVKRSSEPTLVTKKRSRASSNFLCFRFNPDSLFPPVRPRHFEGTFSFCFSFNYSGAEMDRPPRWDDGKKIEREDACIFHFYFHFFQSIIRDFLKAFLKLTPEPYFDDTDLTVSLILALVHFNDTDKVLLVIPYEPPD